MTRSSPLRLEEIVFPQVSVKALVPRKGQERRHNFEVDDLEVNFAFDMSDDGKGANAALKLSTKEQSADGEKPSLPYAVVVEVFAHFDVLLPEHTDAKALWFRKFSAAAALIGAAREQVAMMTARGPWGVALMPMINMDVAVGPPPSVESKPAATEGLPKPKRARRKLPSPT